MTRRDELASDPIAPLGRASAIPAAAALPVNKKSRRGIVSPLMESPHWKVLTAELAHRPDRSEILILLQQRRLSRRFHEFGTRCFERGTSVDQTRGEAWRRSRFWWRAQLFQDAGRQYRWIA